MSNRTLVVELFTEELPPKALKVLGEAFADVLAAYLRGQDFLATDSIIESFATPRRLAVAITKVRSTAPDKAFKEKLLPVSVAFDAEGKPTPALLGKLGSCPTSNRNRCCASTTERPRRFSTRMSPKGGP